MSALGLAPPGSDASRTIPQDCGEWSALIEEVEDERSTDVLGMAVLRAYAHHAEHNEWPKDPEQVLPAPSPEWNRYRAAYSRSAPGEFPPFSLGVFDLDVNALIWWSAWDEFASELTDEQRRRLAHSDLQ